VGRLMQNREHSYWDRGRLARNEREARKDLLGSSYLQCCDCRRLAVATGSRPIKLDRVVPTHRRYPGESVITYFTDHARREAGRLLLILA
jgi:hypothetical protein